MTHIDKQNCWSLINPSHLNFPYSWVGHTPFAMWLICKLGPNIFVELGTHSGNSYFAICESIKAHALKTQCYAIDTWQGDPHANFYSEDIFTSVNSHNTEHYASFSNLMRMTFDEALGTFENNQIDILHIDGLHTYDAVKHDYTSWLCKMKSNGVILFHDITVRENDFGVFKLWEELKNQYPYHFEFHHSNGLGVLFLEKPSDPEILTLLNNQNKTLIQQFEISGIQQTFMANLNSLNTLLKDNPSERLSLEREFNTLVHKYNQLLSETQTALIELRVDEIQNQLNRILNSTSWKLTLPIRLASELLRKMARILKKNLMLIKKANDFRNQHGFKALLRRIYQQINLRNHQVDYNLWFKRDLEIRLENIKNTPDQNILNPTLFSIIMPVYNSDIGLLEAAIKSVQSQIYTHWELCICNDASTNEDIKPFLDSLSAADSRIKVYHATSNGHISKASNLAIEQATGNFLVLLDHDDLLTIDALFWVNQALIDNPTAKLIYSDEDKIHLDETLSDPYFKTDWNFELILGQNYFSHLGVYETALVKSINGFREGFEGAQDYDLLLRCAEKVKPSDIIHIPKVLYHWRVVPGSTSINIAEKPYAINAAKQAIKEFAQNNHLIGEVEVFNSGLYRLIEKNPIVQPSVTLIIPTYNGFKLIKNCIESILNKTTYQNFSILIIDNRSDEPQTLNYLKQIQSRHPKIKVVRDESPFNYSAINNRAVDLANSEYVLLLNNDTQVISNNWLTEMMRMACRPGVGVVGAKLLYPDNRVQHAGVILGLGGIAGHAFHLKEKTDPGYFGLATLPRVVTAVTGACLLVKKSIYKEVEGLDETHLTVAFNDVDFCLKVMSKGYRNVWTPFAELYHFESITRGLDTTPEKQARFESEIQYMANTWPNIIAKDPFYNINLSLNLQNAYTLKHFD
ncbi:hypothetical protein THMIRHAT_20550 [Thiosulfativibrio zosterae]|uniref:Glycosyltransferase 2-like domain-containing protein n=2 Tax=Thiosulfativibrio zosterae TaxID=2675053 RepID=A0A6F8PQB7_9GAMM|nr:hypothetical protein THMIRHAT_20550 [Thiosulfativibrio zosterae]